MSDPDTSSQSHDPALHSHHQRKRRHPHHRPATPHPTHHKPKYDDQLFKDKAPFIMALLMKDFDLTPVQAAAILGNIGTESAGFHTLHEAGQKEGKGGYGWAQWTGVRRKKFFAWLAKHHWVSEWTSDAPNYLYLKEDLKTTYASIITLLKKQTDLNKAVFVFEDRYEHAGVPNLGSRDRYAKIALDEYKKNTMPQILRNYVQSVWAQGVSI
jgi:hypothetical protein